MSAAPAAVSATESKPKHKRVPSEVVINKNVNWLGHHAVWVWYISLVVLGWLGVCAFVEDTGLAWSITHLLHGVITYYLMHYLKGSPFAEDDQGKYSRQTFWEQVRSCALSHAIPCKGPCPCDAQMDNGVYATRNRKIFTAMPVILFLLATNGTDFRKQPLGLNLVVVVWLVLAKLPAFHRVRIFGINKY